MRDLKELIRDIPDYPKAGVLFRDITPLLADADALKQAVEAIAEPFKGQKIDVVAAAEARGFIFGPAVAMVLGAGFVPIRKPGKLPFDTHSLAYELEYGTDELQMHIDGIDKGDRVLVVDDLLATGGTVEACLQLIRRCEAHVVACSFLVHLKPLGGHHRLSPSPVHSVLLYDEDEQEAELSIQNRQPGPSV